MSKVERKQTQYLMDILERIDRIKSKIGVCTYREFLDNIDLSDIVSLNVIIIGEATSKLDLNLLYEVNSDKMYWRKIIDTRNYLLQESHVDKLKTIYEISIRELDELEKYVREMLTKVTVLVPEFK